MAVINIGSINIDYVHRVPHFPQAGETLRNLSYAAGLGGKGAGERLREAPPELAKGERQADAGHTQADQLKDVAGLIPEVESQPHCPQA